MASLGKVNMEVELKNHPFGKGCIVFGMPPVKTSNKESCNTKQDEVNQTIADQKNKSAGEPK